MLRAFVLLAIGLFLPCCGRPVVASKSGKTAALIQPLIDPAKLATLGDRGANTRIQKITVLLWEAKQTGLDAGQVAAESIERIGWGGLRRGG